jgi:hypothetical protein
VSLFIYWQCLHQVSYQLRAKLCSRCEILNRPVGRPLLELVNQQEPPYGNPAIKGRCNGIVLHLLAWWGTFASKRQSAPNCALMSPHESAGDDRRNPSNRSSEFGVASGQSCAFQAWLTWEAQLPGTATNIASNWARRGLLP